MTNAATTPRKWDAGGSSDTGPKALTYRPPEEYPRRRRLPAPRVLTLSLLAPCPSPAPATGPSIRTPASHPHHHYLTARRACHMAGATPVVPRPAPRVGPPCSQGSVPVGHHLAPAMLVPSVTGRRDISPCSLLPPRRTARLWDAAMVGKQRKEMKRRGRRGWLPCMRQGSVYLPLLRTA